MLNLIKFVLPVSERELYFLSFCDIYHIVPGLIRAGWAGWVNNLMNNYIIILEWP